MIASPSTRTIPPLLQPLERVAEHQRLHMRQPALSSERDSRSSSAPRRISMMISYST